MDALLASDGAPQYDPVLKLQLSFVSPDGQQHALRPRQRYKLRRLGVFSRQHDRYLLLLWIGLISVLELEQQEAAVLEQKKSLADVSTAPDGDWTPPARLQHGHSVIDSLLKEICLKDDTIARLELQLRTQQSTTSEDPPLQPLIRCLSTFN